MKNEIILDERQRKLINNNLYNPSSPMDSVG